MRNLFRWMVLLVLSLCLYLPNALSQAYASETVIDQAGLFTKEEITEIDQAISTFKTENKMDAVVLTTDNAEGKSAMEVADDYYDQHNYGTGPDKSGFLFLIDMDNRTYYISTAGKMMSIIDGNRRERMLDHAENEMYRQQYGQAALSILEDMTTYASRYDYNQETGQLSRVRTLSPLKILIGGVVGIISAIACYSSIFSKYSLKRSTYNYDYRQNGSLELLDRQDQLVNTFTTSRYVPRANYGNGNHTSGGGNSHGGGGRSF
ncbi:TPM domain-containing protein [Vagococcus sp. PNs007]|uniref:TPM domain-containing protein n=1 Tax=Vagococcus proximus TaxID=2991417 RepID=A0ABT5WY62_9ENTE|nr:TPM domain-containing protein [Vagococcus proximus]MDF0478696.1 TPM domain-containing protein [Vagococcus proximus]